MDAYLNVHKSDSEVDIQILIETYPGLGKLYLINGDGRSSHSSTSQLNMSHVCH